MLILFLLMQEEETKHTRLESNLLTLTSPNSHPQTQKDQDANTQKNNDSNPQKKGESNQDMHNRIDTQPKHLNLKDTKAPSNSQASSHRQLINNKQPSNNRDEAQGAQKNVAKNANQKPQGTDNKGDAAANQGQALEVGMILDDELLKDLAVDNARQEGAGNNEQDNSNRMKDSVSLDFENLKSHSPIVESGGGFDLRKDDANEAGGDKSLTLNLTDLKIESHF